MKEHITIIFLGDFFFDSRCINMANSIIDFNIDLAIIDTSNSKINQYRNSQIYHISIPNLRIRII